MVEYRREVEGFGSGDAGGQATAMPKSVLAMNKVDLVSTAQEQEVAAAVRRVNGTASQLRAVKAQLPLACVPCYD